MSKSTDIHTSLFVLTIREIGPFFGANFSMTKSSDEMRQPNGTNGCPFGVGGQPRTG